MKWLGDLFMVLIVPLACLLVAVLVAVVFALPQLLAGALG